MIYCSCACISFWTVSLLCLSAARMTATKKSPWMRTACIYTNILTCSCSARCFDEHVLVSFAPCQLAVKISNGFPFRTEPDVTRMGVYVLLVM